MKIQVLGWDANQWAEAKMFYDQLPYERPPAANEWGMRVVKSVWYMDLKHREPTGTPILQIVMSPLRWREASRWAHEAVDSVWIGLNSVGKA